MSDICIHCNGPVTNGKCPGATPETMEDALTRVTAERDQARAEVERMRPVYEAAKEWWAATVAVNGHDFRILDDKMRGRDRERLGKANAALGVAIDTALSTATGENGREG